MLINLLYISNDFRIKVYDNQKKFIESRTSPK